MTATLVIDQLAQAAEHAPQAPLLSGRSGEEWQRLTNARAWAQSGAVASWLIAQGFGPDGRSLAVPAGDTPQRAVLLLGALRAGALVVPGPEHRRVRRPCPLLDRCRGRRAAPAYRCRNAGASPS